MMTSELETDRFLKDFIQKLEIFQVVYLNRGKNLDTLLQLGIRAEERTEILKGLQVVDYSQGPLPEEMYGTVEMWVFGKIVRGREVYIKITTGKPGASVLCISFHLAEHPMKYPFKKKT